MDKIKRYQSTLILLFFLFFAVFGTACSKKVGCPGEEAQVKLNKKGMPTSKPKSGLFDKKTTKKLEKY